MEILAWLVPPVVVTIAAMIWASYAGWASGRDEGRSEADYERFSEAIKREHPAASLPRPERPRDRSTGIAVRPSRSVHPEEEGPDTRATA